MIRFGILQTTQFLPIRSKETKPR
uniref:Uncharacterized protein n=1 Tax=Anguilla anguilla TaxID=7936 RepID=A0A0E9P8R2_ANGAN